MEEPYRFLAVKGVEDMLKVGGGALYELNAVLTHSAWKPPGFNL
jgi:hypothetical protein